MDEIKDVVLKLSKFKEAMGLTLDLEKAKYIWGKKEVRRLQDEGVLLEKKIFNPHVDSKIKIVKENISKLKVFNWVKFIGVSGSVAAGFVKEDDDIDLFIVVKNSTVWLYRGVLALRGLFNGLFRAKRHGERVKNKFCLNLICEERGLLFEGDMFNFHELMYVIPVENDKYLNRIYMENSWLKEYYFVKKELLASKIVEEKKANGFIRFLNICAFGLQLSFMFLVGHSPEVKRLRENFKKGRIEFFPKDYKEEFIRN